MKSSQACAFVMASLTGIFFAAQIYAAETTLLGTSGTVLVEVDQYTGLATALSGAGLAGFADVRGMAFDTTTGTLYATAGDGVSTLFTIDVATSGITVVGTVGHLITGLAFDSNTNTLFGVGLGAKQLLSIDLFSGMATVIGQLGPSGNCLNGLSFDPNSNTLFGADWCQDELSASR